MCAQSVPPGFLRCCIWLPLICTDLNNPLQVCNFLRPIQFIAHINPNCCFFSFCMNVLINPENSLQNSLSPGGVRFTTVALQQQLLLASNFCELIEMSTRVQTKNSCDCCSATWIISTFQRRQGLEGTFGWVKQ